MENQAKFEVKPPSGVSPRPEDTPRTRNLKELRKKRLQYFETKNHDSSSTTDSSGVENILNNAQDMTRRAVDENVRVSMAADSRVIAMEGNRDLSRPSSGVQRDSTARNSLQLSNSFHRNTLDGHQDAFDANNNDDSRDFGHMTGSGNILGRAPVAGALQTGFNGSVRREGLNINLQNQRPSGTSSLGFSLPHLYPNESNIVTPRDNNQAPKTPKVSKPKKAKPAAKKVKPVSVRGTSAKKPSTSGRQSFENSDSYSESQNDARIIGQRVVNKERSNMQIRKSVIEADFEDDYSELGLSVDRQRGGFQIPGFSPSHKPKTNNNDGGAMRGSQSVEHFGGLSVSAIREELHHRPEAAESYEFTMRRSATHDGLVNHTGNMNTTISGEQVFDSVARESIQDAEFTARSVGSSVDNEAREVIHPPPAHQSIGEWKSVTNISADLTVPSVPKLMFSEKPVSVESVDFEKTKIQSNTDTNESAMSTRSVIQQEFSSTMLQTILGKDRLERLLKNLEESEWLDEKKSAVVDSQTRIQDLSLDSFRSDSEVGGERGGAQRPTFMSQNTEVSDLGLTTHRPQGENKGFQAQEGQTSSVSDQQSNDNVVESGGSSLRKSTKCSFSSDEIYARARKVSHTSTEAETEHISNPSGKHESAGVATTSVVADLSGKKQNEEGFDEYDGGTKFDYIRGIHSVKKEFYKTVAVTDSTAVSDTSMSTTKQSKQSVDSPRGQIPSQRQGVQGHAPGHRRTGSASGWLGPKSQEEHIEGIRQHVADIRIQQFEEKIKSGIPYTTSSIERYFASMEKLNLEPTNCFEPIPEPDIMETPRDPNKDKDLGVSGSKIENKTSSDNLSRKVLESERNQKFTSPNSTNGVNNTLEVNHAASTGMKKNSNIDKALSSKVTLSDEQKSLTQREKWEQFKLDNDKRKALNDLLKEDGSNDDEDDLFTKVTSMVDDERMTARLKDIGIDFEFLKKERANDDSLMKKPCISNEMDLLSHHSSEDNQKVSLPRKNNHVGAKSSKRLPTEAEGNKSADDEVEILFRMSPRNKNQNSSAGQLALGPTPSGEPTQSKTGLQQKVDGSFDSSFNQSQLSSSLHQVKVCPECAEVNKIYVTWCVECGAVLSGIDPVPCKAKRDVTRQLGLSSSTSLSQSATNFKNRLEESMYNPAGASVSATWLQQSQSRSTEKLSAEKHQEGGSKEVLNLKLEGGVRDSDDFEYETEQSPVRALPKALQSELSLDLTTKPERSSKAGKPALGKVNDQLAELSETIQFEYNEAESPKKLLPVALQEELNLNLSLDGSQTTASLFGAATSAFVPASGPSWKNKAGGSCNNGQLGLHLEEECRENEDINPPANEAGRVDLGVQVRDPMQNNDDGGLDEEVPIDEVDEDADSEEEERIIYNQFVKRLMTDPRFKTQGARPQSAMHPTQSSSRPKTSVAGSRPRPQSAKPSISKVRQSIEREGYQRKWASSSTSAWNTLSHGEVRPRSSLRASIEAEVRPSSAVLRGRPSSAVSRVMIGGPGGDARPKSSIGKPEVSSQASRSLGRVRESKKTGSSSANVQSKDKLQSSFHGSTSASPSKSLKTNLMNTYAKYFEMSPRIASGEFSQWLCLPDEIWLHICSYLSQDALGRVAQTCMQLHRVALDESLWKKITVKKNHNMIDEWLAEMGRRQPASLSLVQCHGEKVTPHGLRELFRHCADSLKELNFTGCSRGEMKGDNILLHAASRCRNITHFDASWSNVNDHGVVALIDASHRLESVCLNGCQVVTDEAIHALVTKHGKSLTTLELFGCFNVTPRSAASIAASCKTLTILNLGQCWKLTDVSISRLAPSLTEVINLDLRGCKQMKDTTIHHLMHHCKKLQSLSIANCLNLTDVSLTEIATYCSSIQSLDLCGCKGITDMGVRAIAMACHSLEYLDVSSSAITHKSVSTIASYCHNRLEVLKLNFCKHINVPSLVRLAKNCKKIRKVYLYGVNGIRNIDEVRRVNSNLWIEL